MDELMRFFVGGAGGREEPGARRASRREIGEIESPSRELEWRLA
jgi:hypothetical protein